MQLFARPSHHRTFPVDSQDRWWYALSIQPLIQFEVGRKQSGSNGRQVDIVVNSTFETEYGVAIPKCQHSNRDIIFQDHLLISTRLWVSCYFLVSLALFGYR